MMSKADFAVVADVFRIELRRFLEAPDHIDGIRYEVIRAFAFKMTDDFEKAYPRFNRKEFLTRAGITTDRV